MELRPAFFKQPNHSQAAHPGACFIARLAIFGKNHALYGAHTIKAGGSIRFARCPVKRNASQFLQ